MYKWNLFSCKEKWNHNIPRKVDGTENYEFIQNSPDLERQISHVFSHMHAIYMHMYVRTSISHEKGTMKSEKGLEGGGGKTTKRR